MKVRELLFEDKSDYVAKTFGEKLVSALMADDSEEAKRLKKSVKGLRGDADPNAPGRADMMQELAAKIVAELIKVDPKFDDWLIEKKESLASEIEATTDLTAKLAKQKELRRIENKLNGPADKYLVWIARMYCNKQFKLEDISRIRMEIVTFETFKDEIENKDLNSYKSLPALYDATDSFAERMQELRKKEGEEEVAGSDDVEWLIRGKYYKALIPKTVEASCKYGAGTRWCTAATGSHNYYDSYAKQGDLVIVLMTELEAEPVFDAEGKPVLNKSGKQKMRAKRDVHGNPVLKLSNGKPIQRKFQFHYETHSFMDERDQRATPADIKALSLHPEHLEWLKGLIKKHLDNDGKK